MKRTASSALLTGLLAVSAFAAEPVSRRDAARLQAKLDRITKGNPAAGRRRRRQPITETEVNSYLQYRAGRSHSGRREGPVGLDPGKRASVGQRDGRSRAGGAEPQVGRHARPVQLPHRLGAADGNGVLRTKNGVATFALESASISERARARLDAPGNRQLLLEIGIGAQGVAIDKPFVASLWHPRNPDRSRAGDGRAVGPGSGSEFRFSVRRSTERGTRNRNLEPSRVYRLPSDPAPVSERRWAEARRRPPARRPCHRRRSPLPISPSLRRPRTPAADLLAESRPAGRHRGTDSEQPSSHDAPARDSRSSKRSSAMRRDRSWRSG